MPVVVACCVRWYEAGQSHTQDETYCRDAIFGSGWIVNREIGEGSLGQGKDHAVGRF